MPLQIGQPLVDLASGEARFRLVELLTRGANFDVAIAEDLHLDDKRVALKAIRYHAPHDPDDVAARRGALESELRLLTLPSSLLPEPLDWLRIQNESDFAHDAGLAQSEPILVYELQHGTPMGERIDELAPEGIPVERALRIAREIALFLGSVHDHDRVLRVLEPDKVIVDVDDIIHIVGLAGATATGAPPLAPYVVRESGFVAPEARNAPTPRALVPAVDVYSLGGILLFLLTGRRPLQVVESPFDDLAYHRLGGHGAGVAKLVARMLASDPARRFRSIDDLLPLLDSHALPDPGHPELARVEVPSPWKEAPPVGPAHQNKLSAGPLVSTPRGQEQSQAAGADAPADAEQDTPPAKADPSTDSPVAKRWRTLSYVMAGTASLLVIVLAIVMALL